MLTQLLKLVIIIWKFPPPIFKGTNIKTNNPTLISFGVTSNQQSPKQEYQLLSQMTLGKYMEGPNRNDTYG